MESRVDMREYVLFWTQ